MRIVCVKIPGPRLKKYPKKQAEEYYDGYY